MARLTKFWPRNWTGLPWMMPWSLAAAMREPVVVSAPSMISKPSAPRLTGPRSLMLTRNSPMPTRAAASAPNAWESAVRCGMAVMGTETAIHAPMMDPSAKPAMKPGPGDDVGPDERAYDGGEHAALGQEHAAPRGVGVRHHLERQDEQDRRNQVRQFHEICACAIRGRVHLEASFAGASRLRNILSMRSVMPNPPTTLTVAVVTATKPRMCADSG